MMQDYALHTKKNIRISCLNCKYHSESQFWKMIWCNYCNKLLYDDQALYCDFYTKE